MVMEDVFVLSAVRTPIGKYGGGLAAVPPGDLAALVVREAVSRSGVDSADVGHVVFGNVIHTEIRDMYLARVAALNGGLETGTPALTLNRLCGSGLQAIVSAAQAIMLGDCQLAVAGGAESMSRAPYWLPGMRWGQRMNDGVAADPMVGALTDPFDACHMGVTAENVAEEFHVSRADQDALAAQSHHRAAAAIAAGYFTEQIVPVQVKGRKGSTTVDTDEHVRPDVSLEDLARLRPAFRNEGTVTAGNASGLNDAAAAVVLASESFVTRSGLTPMGKLAGYGHAGVEPRIMGMGPVPAVRNVLDRTGVKLDEIDVFEVNEAFAAQALAVASELGLPPDRTNPNGSGISLGHPIGATGAILTVKALYELRRTGSRYALVTMCIGGGQGIAAIFERVLSRGQVSEAWDGWSGPRQAPAASASHDHPPAIAAMRQNGCPAGSA
jgi:acetyl-CoA C-acetyltransferase